MKLSILYKKDFIKTPEKRKKFKMSLGKLADDILKSENVNVSALNIIFCSDEFIRDHNKRFLGHDYETDIITFHDTEEEGRIEGELLISIDTVKSNATKYKTTLNNELRRVVIHGILHLCGYNDKTHAEKKQIRKKEDHFLNNK